MSKWCYLDGDLICEDCGHCEGAEQEDERDVWDDQWSDDPELGSKG